MPEDPKDPERAELLLNHLAKPEWVSLVNEKYLEVMHDAWFLYEFDDEEVDPDLVRTFYGNWFNSIHSSLSLNELERMLSIHIEKFPSPCVAITGELVEAFTAYFERYRDIDQVEGDYKRFLDHVNSRMLREHDLKIKVCRVTDLPSKDMYQTDIGTRMLSLGRDSVLGELDTSDLGKSNTLTDESIRLDGLVFWSQDDLELRCDHIESIRRVRSTTRSGDESDNEKPYGDLVVSLTGRMTEKASENICSDLLPLLRCAMRCAALVSHGSDYRTDLPLSIKLSCLIEHKQFIAKCMKFAYVSKSGKGTLSRRLGNAVRLLAESDSQQNVAVSLGLAVTAIDALLGQKGDSATKVLAERVAVLMEPKLEMRTSAERFVEKIYDKRSDVLHGRDVQGSDKDYQKSRLLASGILYSVWFRSDTLAKMAVDHDTPEDLVKDLRNLKYTEGQPTGVLPIPQVQQLWRESNKPSAS
ncbi:MAG: hypothetical protein RIG82_02505 [Phycisphaeraceae bacterium]